MSRTLTMLLEQNSAVAPREYSCFRSSNEQQEFGSHTRHFCYDKSLRTEQDFNRKKIEVRIPMATSIAAGSGKLNFKERVCWGHGCRQTSWVSGVAFQRFELKELSWVVGFPPQLVPQVFESLAVLLSELDVLLSFADLAISCPTPYTRPDITTSNEVDILVSRHRIGSGEKVGSRISQGLTWVENPHLSDSFYINKTVHTKGIHCSRDKPEPPPEGCLPDAKKRQT
ncbi:DNA mismatch repair protein MSH2 [Camellia lanceoleosa]|uniref:DNA mismatch repair protein MSH2 n=1 Tax=Camellia lanceoleosa TaxID=1840588 RepID=A0ACC0J388_9ERIC|nr:DNA mismatch repair protein MSH2 [Camellia lanceoleosa]